jgi:recombination protein RecT
MIIYRASHLHDEFVSLDDGEIDEAALFGKEMYQSSQRQGLKDYRPEVRDGVTGERIQMLGSVAERGASKALGIPWTHWIGTFHQPDLHHNIEVRLIGVNHYGLRVYDKDHDSRRVVGVVIEKGKEREPYRLPGWIYAADAKQASFRMDPHEKNHPMYAVPQYVLRPLSELKEIILVEKKMATNLQELQKNNESKALSEMSHKDQVKYLLESNRDAIMAALPKHLSAERLLQVATQVAITTPGLKNCYVPSLIGGIMQCTMMGLEPNTVLGHAYLIPFRNKKKNRTDVQVIIGYKGLIDLARRSGQIISIAAHEVCQNDHFDYMYGLVERLEHKPADGERGEITHFYAVAHMKDGGHAFEVMTKAAVQLVMKGSQSKGEYGPWKDFFSEMGRKTVWRRLAKYCPISVDLARGVNLDETGAKGADQSLDRAITGDYEVLDIDEAPEVRGGETDVIRDANGVQFDPDAHVENENGPVFNNDGTFRKKRGTAAKKDTGGASGAGSSVASSTEAAPPAGTEPDAPPPSDNEDPGPSDDGFNLE